MGCHVSCCNIDPNEFLSSQNFTNKLSLGKHENSILTLPKSASVPRKMRTTTETLLSSRTNFLELEEALTRWLLQVYSPLEHDLCDIETTVAYHSSTGLLFTHSINGFKDFTVLKQFSESFPQFDSPRFDRNIEFLKQSRPLGVNFYLFLGEEIDCGMGIEKPMSKTHLAQFLDNFEGKDTVLNWVSSSLICPIPTYFGYSSISDLRTVAFYIFGGHKRDNYNKAYQLFECLDVALRHKLSDSDSTSEDVKCELTLYQSKVSKMKCQAPCIGDLRKGVMSLGVKPTRGMASFAELVKPTSLSVDCFPDHSELILHALIS